MAIARIPLSTIARDPSLKAFFVSGERDNGMEPSLAKPPLPYCPAGGEEAIHEDDARLALSVHMGGARRLARVMEDA